MKKLKEPEIKLFGRKIVLPENGGVVAAVEESFDETDNGSGGGGGDCDRCVEVSGGGEGEGEKSDDEKQPPLDEEAQETENSETKQQERDQKPNSSPELDSNPKNPPIDEDVVSENNPKTQENAPTDRQQLTLKKPDKILPCPRCNSMDTKFCYYNNYNVNQPRHFCKSCQRYWTAGGTMRNVPVGAGRRKNKNSASHCHHITISEALHAARAVDPPNGLHHSSFKPNGNILSFRPDSPLCESMASALDLAYKRAQNGCHKNGENTNDSSVQPSVTTPNPGPEGGENRPEKPVLNNTNGFPVPVPCVPGENGPEKPVINNTNVFQFPVPVPCVPGIPWNYPWNPAVPLPAICPIPFYPTPYWNYNVPNSWDFPWLTAQSPTANQTAIAGSGPGSPLGKHSRNGELIKLNRSENKEQLELRYSESSIVIPKTLRIDDPEEAAKSSIWETLGIKYDSISRECLFKALQPKGSEGKHKISASPVLQANPAAVLRSISFQEGH